jgi:ABC-2 type transport system permease protein
MNIYLHELKSKLRSVLTWSTALVGLIFVFMSLFQSFAEQTALVNELMQSFPEELLIAFGMTNLDWSIVIGFFGLVFGFCQIFLAIQSANYGFSLVSIEESEWTADFLLAKPVTRSRILTGKLLAALTALAITCVSVWISSFLFIDMFRGTQELPSKPLILLLLTIPVFQLFFLSAGLLISLLVKRVRSVTPFTMALVFGLYILNAFGAMIGKKNLEVLSPFMHFAPSDIIQNEAWNLPFTLLSLTFITVSIIGCYILYSKRNISSAV